MINISNFFFFRLCLKVRGGVNGQLFSLTNEGNTRTITEGITQRGGSEIVYRSFANIPNDIYYWVLPENFRGDKVQSCSLFYRPELFYSFHIHSNLRKHEHYIVLSIHLTLGNFHVLVFTQVIAAPAFILSSLLKRRRQTA